MRQGSSLRRSVLPKVRCSFKTDSSNFDDDFKMAEAAVENPEQTENTKFYCHQCSVEIRPKLPVKYYYYLHISVNKCPLSKRTFPIQYKQISTFMIYLKSFSSFWQLSCRYFKMLLFYRFKEDKNAKLHHIKIHI